MSIQHWKDISIILSTTTKIIGTICPLELVEYNHVKAATRNIGSFFGNKNFDRKSRCRVDQDVITRGRNSMSTGYNKQWNIRVKTSIENGPICSPNSIQIITENGGLESVNL